MTVISRAQLPGLDSVVFPNTSFFRDNGKHATLPAPTAIRKEASRPKTGVWANKPWCVPFVSQRLVVKYGQQITIAEAQCLWAVRQKLHQQVPVPEVYGWCRDEDEVFIYMQFIPGPTLESVLDQLERNELVHIMSQLRQIVIAFRSLRQSPEESFLGKLILSGF